ncbi:MAG: hypothetical protein RSD95_16715, partial [Clostridia bacterium]
MAKCTRCGKKGLFLRVDSDGMCPRCQPIFQCEKQLRELDDQLSQAERDLNDKEGLLRNAKEAAKDEAFRQLEAESSRLRSDIST